MQFLHSPFTNNICLIRKEFSKEFTKNPEVIVHASSTSRLFEMLNSKTSKKDRKIGLGVSCLVLNFYSTFQDLLTICYCLFPFGRGNYLLIKFQNKVRSNCKAL